MCAYNDMVQGESQLYVLLLLMQILSEIKYKL